MKNELLERAELLILASLARREAKESDQVMTRDELKSPYFKWAPGIKIDTNRKN